VVSKAKLGQSEKLATFKRVANLKNHQGFVAALVVVIRGWCRAY